MKTFWTGEKRFENISRTETLSSVMKLIALPGGSKLVTQIDLENFLSYEAQMARAQNMRDRIAASILSRLSEGASVEEGSRAYEIEESYEGASRILKLIVR